MFFRDIVGQEQIKKQLLATVKEGRIPHAQLFLGPEGSGNLALAIAYAQLVACENPGETDSCGVCHSCKKYQKLIHPDLHFAFPVNTSKDGEKDPVSDHFIVKWRELVLATPYFSESRWYEHIGIENKQGNISKNEAAEIIRKLNLKSFESEYKVVIIWLPERMNEVSANKLLKLVEEPPEKTIFLLVSENSERIIKTILSRTQLVKVPLIERSKVAEAVVAQFGLDAQQANSVARIANGNYALAQQLATEGVQSEAWFEAFQQLMRLSYKKDVISLMEWAEEMAGQGRERQKSFLEYAQKLTRDSFMVNMGAKDVAFPGKNEEAFVQNFSPFIYDTVASLLYKELNLAYAQISQNGNGKIIFTDLVLKTVKLIKSKN